MSPLAIIILLAVYLGGMYAIGVWAQRLQKSVSESEYFIAGWSVGGFPIACSIVATFCSASWILGTTGVFYRDPASLGGYVFGAVLAPVVLWTIGRKLWILGRRYTYSTYTDFLGDFYQSNAFRAVVSVLVVLFVAPYFAVNLIGPGVLINRISGGVIPQWVGFIAIMVITTLYTFKGGMRGVIYTDVVQTLLILGFFLVLIPALLANAGGIITTWKAVPADVIVPKTSWGGFWQIVSWFVLITLHQPGSPDRAFRLLVARDLHTLRRGVIYSGVLLGLFSIIAYFLAMPLNVLTPGVKVSDEVVIIAVQNYAPLLIPLLLLGMWAASMSTLDSGMIAGTAMIVKDVYKRIINPEATDQQTFKLSKGLIIFWGLFALCVSMMKIPYLWFLTGAAASISMQWLPPLLFGLYWKRANTPAAWAGFLSGIVVSVAFQYFIKGPIPLPGGPAIMGFLFNIPIFVIVALLTKPFPQEHIEKYQGVF